MSRPIVLATVVVALAVLGYLAIAAVQGPGRGGADLQATSAPPPTNEVADANTSTIGASTVASDQAFQSTQAGEEPVQSNIATSRELAVEAGAVGGAAFTPEGYDRVTVVNAIEESNLEDAEKDELMARLAEAEPAEAELELALAQIRERLARVE